jgi:hypothetical protein
MRALLVGVVLLGGLVFSACSPSIDDETAHDLDPDPPGPTSESATPAVSDVVGDGTFTYTDGNGFTADIDYTWHRAAVADYGQIAALPPAPGTTNANCATSIEVWADLNGEVDPENLTFMRVRLNGSVDFPVVGGFQWPKDQTLFLVLSENDAGGSGWLVCAPTTEFNPPDGGRFDLNLVYYGERTPNDPNGTIDASLEDLIFSAGRDSFSLQEIGTYPG